MSNGDANSGLIDATLDIAQKNFGLALTYIGLIMAISVAAKYLDQIGAVTIAQGIVTAMLALPAHMTVLKGAAVFDGLSIQEQGHIFGPFALRLIGLVIMALFPSMVVLFLLLITGVLVVPDLVVVGILPLLLVVGVFAKWGTMLPAVVVGDDKSMKAAGARGSLTMRYAFPRLLVPLLILPAIQIFCMLVFVGFSTGDGYLFSDEGGFDLYVFAGTLLAAFIGVFQVVMTAVILSHAYLAAKGHVAATQITTTAT